MMDPEAYEPTEEQFAASVSPAHAAAQASSPEPRATASPADDLGPNHRARTRLSGIQREFAERNALEANLDAKAEFWRDEVADRVEGYRNKRAKKRLSGEFSMKLEFDPRPHRASAATAPAYAESAPDFAPQVQARSHPAYEPVNDFEEPAPSAARGQAGAAEDIPTLRYAQDGAPADTPTLRYAQDGAPADIPTLRYAQDGAPEGISTLRRAQDGAAADIPTFRYAQDGAAVDMEPAWQPGEPAMSVPQQAQPVPAKPPARLTKIIEFPRSLVFPEFADASQDPNELAEPVLDKPRILDVPETVSVTAPPLADVALGPEPEEDAGSTPAFELPLRVAPLPQRFTAAVADWLLVLAGTALFALVVFRSVADLPHGKPLIGLAGAMPVVLWAVYHYLFLVYGAITPGMQMAGIRLSTFEGAHAPRHIRRWRAVVMVLSCVSLGFGFLWALFDEDNLSWHDKMTHTYLTMER